MSLLQLLEILLLTASAAAGILGGLALRSRLLRFDGQLFSVAAPQAPNSPEQLFQALHGLLRPWWRRLTEGQPWISLEICGRRGQVRFQIWIPSGQRPFVESQLRAAYPGIELTPVDEVAPAERLDALADVHLARGNYLPIQTEFDGEPLSSALWTLSRVQGSSAVTLQLLVKPKPSSWHTAAHMLAQGLRDGRRGLRGALMGIPATATASEQERTRAKQIEEKAARLGFDCILRVVASADRPEQAREFVRSVAASLRPYASANSFDFRRVLFRDGFRRRFVSRDFGPLSGFTLNTLELAGLWHLPTDAPPQLQIIRAPKLPPPMGVSTGERLLGLTTYADENLPVRLSIGDSRRHLHLLGPTGTGKTTAMINLALQDIAAGRGVGVIDPKGDLVAGILARLPRNRIDDVVLISPESSDLTVGLNPLEAFGDDDRDLVAENTLTIFKRIYERYWGMRTDDILKSVLLTLLRQPNSTLAHIPLLLTDAGFRARTIAGLNDPIGLGNFWSWFGNLTDAQRSEAIGPVLNKLRDFLVRPRLRRLLCQPHSTVDLRRVVDSGQILLADLSVGRWGDTTAALIGSFLVAKLWQAVLARAAIPEEKRRDYFLFIDEFQHFLGISGPFADTLAQARSLRLSLTIANQHLGQLPRDLREAITSNARSRVTFQSGQDDATYLAREFAPLDASALMSLPRFEMAARISIDGETSPAFTARTLPSPGVTDPSIAADAAAASQTRFGRHVAVIDRELLALLAPMDEPQIPEFGVGRRPRR